MNSVRALRIQASPGPVEAEGMRDVLFQLFFILAGTYGGVRIVDDVKWVRGRRLARAESR